MKIDEIFVKTVRLMLKIAVCLFFQVTQVKTSEGGGLRERAGGQWEVHSCHARSFCCVEIGKVYDIVFVKRCKHNKHGLCHCCEVF